MKRYKIFIEIEDQLKAPCGGKSKVIEFNSDFDSRRETWKEIEKWMNDQFQRIVDEDE